MCVSASQQQNPLLCSSTAVKHLQCGADYLLSESQVTSEGAGLKKDDDDNGAVLSAPPRFTHPPGFLALSFCFPSIA